MFDFFIVLKLSALPIICIVVRIRQEVKPQPSKWQDVFDDSVFKSASWKEVEAAATFWRSYVKPSV